MTMLLAPKPNERHLRGRLVFDCGPRYRMVKAVRVAARIPLLHHRPLGDICGEINVRRQTSSWTRH